MNSADNPALDAHLVAMRRLVEFPAEGRSDVMRCLKKLCLVARARLDAGGASINLMSVDGLDGVVASADARSAARADLQFQTGEGPCHDSYASSAPVLVPDVVQELGRWPGYISAAVLAGARAVFAFPLLVDGAAFGILEIFDDRPRDLDGDQTADARALAQLGVEILLQGQIITPDGNLRTSLATAMRARAAVHQAQGMLMVTLGLTVDEALSLMRSYAFSHQWSLLEVAEAVHRGDRLGTLPR